MSSTKMRIGILTFHCAHNYGAVLQAFALKEHLKSYNKDVDVVNYIPSYFNGYDRNCSIKDCVSTSILRFVKNLIFYIIVKRRHNAFSSFIAKRICPSNKKYNSKDTISGYDTLIYGSDQIWNGLHTNGADNVYWGYMTPDGVKKITYAASSSCVFFVGDRARYVMNALKNFNSISVRENSIARLLQKYTTQTIHSVVDPVFLLTKEEWETKLELNFSSDKYVLVYQVRENPLTLKVAEDYARKNNLKVIILTKIVYQRFDFRLNQTATPESFVGLIRNASLVVTTSFHGTALSIIFRKNFYTISISEEIDERSNSLLQSIGLGDRLISKCPNQYDSPLYNDVVTSRLDKLILNSKEYLKNAIT